MNAKHNCDEQSAQRSLSTSARRDTVGRVIRFSHRAVVCNYVLTPVTTHPGICVTMTSFVQTFDNFKSRLNSRKKRKPCLLVDSVFVRPRNYATPYGHSVHFIFTRWMCVVYVISKSFARQSQTWDQCSVLNE